MSRELTIVLDDPMTGNGYLELDGVTAVSLQNAGSNNVTLGKRWTLLPKSTTNIAVPLEGDVLSERILVEFSGVGTSRLEVMKMYPKGVGSYTQKSGRQ